MEFSVFISIILSIHFYVIKCDSDFRDVFDLNLYEEVLDPDLCREQMTAIAKDPALLFEFLDAGPRIPRGILKGNLVDMGNYYQCLEINKDVEDIHGKYCKITFPLEQNINLPSLTKLDIPWPDLDIPWQDLNKNTTRLNDEMLRKIENFNIMKTKMEGLIGLNFNVEEIRSEDSSILSMLSFKLALCIPKTCSSEQFFRNLVPFYEEIGLNFNEEYCRLPNDKRWVAGEYVAIVIFSVIVIVTIISTGYDIQQTVILKRDSKSVSKLYQSFSVYTNTRRLVSYKPVPGALECLDGIRSFAMMWVIIGHTFSTQLTFDTTNPLDGYDWMVSFWSLWITAATITVDTFFMLSGLLLIYSTAGKMTKTKFLSNIHLFYLNRLLRLFPILAAAVLLQISLFNRLSDGPAWEHVAEQTQTCREYWWATLLYIQNFTSEMCIPHSWYLAIDFQLFLISPLVIYWVVSGNKKESWIALVGSFLAVLIGSTIYNFIMEFPSSSITLARQDDQVYYARKYYINTLARAAPFFVGMIFGYLLHINRGKKVVIPKIYVAVLWFLAAGISTAIICTTYPIIQADWDNQTADNFINSFMRPAWATCLGWLIFACVHGYGGPVNWILSLRMFKLLSRLSYAMYVLHYPLIFVVNGTALAPVHFSTEHSMHKFLVDFSLATMSAFVVTVLVDSPCSTLTKIYLGGSRPAPKIKPVNNDSAENGRKINDIENATNSIPNKSL